MADFLVAEASPDLMQLRYASYIGGSATDSGRASHTKSKGVMAVGVETNSLDWPLIDAVWGQIGTGLTDAVVRQLLLGNE